MSSAPPCANWSNSRARGLSRQKQPSEGQNWAKTAERGAGKEPLSLPALSGPGLSRRHAQPGSLRVGARAGATPCRRASGGRRARRPGPPPPAPYCPLDYHDTEKCDTAMTAMSLLALPPRPRRLPSFRPPSRPRHALDGRRPPPTPPFSSHALRFGCERPPRPPAVECQPRPLHRQPPSGGGVGGEDDSDSSAGAGPVRLGDSQRWRRQERGQRGVAMAGSSRAHLSLCIRTDSTSPTRTCERCRISAL